MSDLERARQLFEADYTYGLRWDPGLGDYILEDNASIDWEEDDDVHEEERGGRIVRVISGDVISERLAALWRDLDTQHYWTARLERTP